MLPQLIDDYPIILNINEEIFLISLEKSFNTQDFARILVIRFSSMGDVLLTAPVLKGALDSDPDLQIDFVTKKNFAPYLSGIERLNLIEADTDQKHKGLLGLYRLSREIRRISKPEMILDLHEVIRSRVLRYFFAIGGIPVYRIDKGRREKKAYLKVRKRKILKHATERYLEVFKNAGIKASIENYPFINKDKLEKSTSTRTKNIGIAPFARHRAKSWDSQNLPNLLRIIDSKINANFYFYGSHQDAVNLAKLDFGESKVTIHAGKMNPQDEIDSFCKLDVFLSMDSANMHLADLIGLPVVSIWGGTHPDLGFRPLNQDTNTYLISAGNLDCQPCSVYGNKACSLSESKYKCLDTITPEIVSAKILSLIK